MTVPRSSRARAGVPAHVMRYYSSVGLLEPRRNARNRYWRVIDAVRIARQEIDATLVLVGNIATDDPEDQKIESLCQCGEDRIRILSVQDSALVNALQCRAAVV